jgi:hypothetical protein
MSPGLQQLYDSLDDKQKAGLNRCAKSATAAAPAALMRSLRQ